MFVALRNIRKPVLRESDTATIWEESGQKVSVRTREHQGSIKLLLKAPSTCDDEVLEAASERAIGFIQYNNAHPPPIVSTKAKQKEPTSAEAGIVARLVAPGGAAVNGTNESSFIWPFRLQHLPRLPQQPSRVAPPGCISTLPTRLQRWWV